MNGPLYLSLFLGTIPRFTTRSILNVWKTIAISKQVEKKSYSTTSFKNTEVELQTTKLENWTSKVEKNIFNVLCLPASTNPKGELMFFDMLQLAIQERGFYPRVLNPKLPELIELNGYPTRKYPQTNVYVRNSFKKLLTTCHPETKILPAGIKPKNIELNGYPTRKYP